MLQACAMLLPALPIGFGLVAATAMVAVAARRLSVPHSILLVLAGLGLGFIPGMPRVELRPDLVLSLLLPPLLYSSGVGMSWRGFKANLRPILLLAVGCVLFTAVIVALLCHYCLGLPLAVGFVLGRGGVASRCGGADGHRPALLGAQPHPDRAGGRGPGQ